MVMEILDPCLREGDRPGRGRPVSPEAVRQNWARAQRVLERAREICRAARMACGKARLQREQHRWLRSAEALLPPLEYVLPPLADLPACRDYLLPPLEVVPEPLEGRLPLFRRPARCRLYVWGYGRARSSLIRQEF